ncbi:MAG: carotenoid oxygenase family protein, partial [Actinobacteria bacterium]|nr:carotenoid oxygenase family protein [Actinomycetota bacterium]
KGRVSGEAVFVASAAAKSEDDGYLMTYVYDAAADTSEFVIFDALTMAADPIATVQLPRVPFGFHGSWVPASVAN